MGLIDRLRGTEGDSAKAPPKAVLAAAMPMNGPGVQRINRGRSHQTQEQWQTEAWYFFDSVGEVRAPLVWIANAVSQADLHATTIDPDTGKPTGPSDDPRSQAVADQVLGGPQQRAGLLRTIALCWQVAGEAWVVVRPDKRAGKPDQWLALSGQKVQAKGNAWVYEDPYTCETVTLTANDRLIRIWCPHPNDQAKADSSLRPALPILREIEKASQNIAARLDSRIATNGIMAIADELDFPKGDFETSAAAFMDFFMGAAEAGLQNPGQASSQVPLAFTAPGELIGNGGAFAHYDLSTEFDQSVVELRDNGRIRLGATLDMPDQVARGEQGEGNHWSDWKVEEDTYKIYIQPLLKAIGDPLSELWMTPALIAMGMAPEQAENEEIGWDTTAIVARPDASETLESLYSKILISDEYMLAEHGVSEDAMPSSEERTRRFLEEAVKVAPTLLADPNVARALGLDVEVSPVAAGVDATVTSGGELEAPEPEPSNVRALPSRADSASEPEPVPEGLVAAAELIVYDALSRAGGRLLTNQNRGQFKSTPRHELYREIPYERTVARIHSLLEGSFEFAEGAAGALGVDPEAFHRTCRAYAMGTLRARARYDRRELTWALRELM